MTTRWPPTRAAEAGLDIDLGYTIPSEGSIDWYDLMYIPADAPHPDNAYLFLDFMLRPEVIARATNFTGYANANRSATALVDPGITSDPAIYPDAETRQRLHASQILSPKLERLPLPHLDQDQERTMSPADTTRRQPGQHALERPAGSGPLSKSSR